MCNHVKGFVPLTNYHICIQCGQAFDFKSCRANVDSCSQDVFLDYAAQLQMSNINAKKGYTDV